MYLCDLICDVLNDSVFDHASCEKHDVTLYVVEETDYMMCMRPQQMVTSFYLSRMVLVILVILIGSTC